MKKPTKIQQLNDNLAKAKEDRTVTQPTARLFVHEQSITKHLETIDTSFFEIGRELAEIRDENDYAESTFEEYVKRRWNKSRDWGYKMIEGYKVKAELPANVENIIQNQSQALAVSKVPKADRPAVLREASKNGQPTAKRISEVAAEFTEVYKDAKGNEIPKSLHTLWAKYNSIGQDVKRYINVIRGECVAGSPFGALPKDLDKHLSNLHANATLELCSCMGKGCSKCSNIGIISSRQWK
jgi:hypothetical protein